MSRPKFRTVQQPALSYPIVSTNSKTSATLGSNHKSAYLERQFKYGRRIFFPREIAERLRVDYTTVTRWIRSGLPEAETIRQGRRNRHRIRKATIETLEASSLPPGLV